ncbi:DUF1769-domain-containing protein [Didymella exigua CBS 183.55]|uniref:DUF1769-domain-containing protein n=1 Tax=Didymella exigua CBS 183.55 TaxID=1150837 RepID=A0A6A5R7N7_9PLEO|nr:DUF1769-domain-containing protein [Didymella exigua CBS 183.55]KAF1923349.1 DUF1769-domain-containing protein [Didymella exigua CBS 183.55]
MAPLHESYELRVTAGATYDRTKHQIVPVNTEKAVHISSDLIDAHLHMRIKDYRGLPKDSPSTSPYFATPPHTYDRYSISFTFVPKRDIRGDKLVFGNDFEHPIRDRLPPLFDKAFGIVKWWIDPGLEGDVYGDEPYLYGALLSSMNVLNDAKKDDAKKDDAKNDKDEKTVEKEEKSDAVVYTEGASGSGTALRASHNIPATSAARQKFFLTESNRSSFTFEAGREYSCDFFNPYLDFNEFALKIGYGLPNISIIGHWDGQPLRPHSLRYTLKDRESDTELLVVVIQLCPTAQAVKDGAKSAEEEFQELHGRPLPKPEEGKTGEGKKQQETGNDDLD